MIALTILQTSGSRQVQCIRKVFADKLKLWKNKNSKNHKF